MRKQNSKQGRPRKIINQGKAKLSFTGIRTNSLWANDVLFLTGLIVYNLLN